MSENVIAALDVGGTKIAGGLWDGERFAVRIERPTPGRPGAGDPGLTTVAAVARELARLARERGERITAAGAGFCEYVDDGRLTSTEVLDWSEQPLDLLTEALDAPVRIESDVRCALLAEARLGALAKVGTGFYVSWGTGISGALLLNSEIWPGTRGRAIALGELPAPDGARLEPFASGAGMARRLGELIGRDFAGGREVMALAVEQPAARQIAESAGEALAEALATVVHLVDPGTVVLGGGLGVDPAHLAQKALRRKWSQLSVPAELRCAGLGADAALLGAALIA